MASFRRDAEFTEFVHARTPWLRRIAYLLCQDWHRADDLTQAVFLKLYVSWDRASKVDRVDGYVRTILINTFLSEQQTTWWKRITLRRTATDEASFIDDAADVGSFGDFGPISDIDGALDLLAALAEVPPRQRAALVLRFYCDLSIAETAGLLDCSPGTVKSQTSRGLDALRVVLGVQPSI